MNTPHDPPGPRLQSLADEAADLPARAPRSLPTGLDKEQQELVKAARDLPLLLVRDGTGKVTRIHVIER